MKKFTKIYLVENCYGDPNKVYIGKTINTREHNHRYTYGENITYNEIDLIESLDKADWKPIETMWIQIFMSWGFEVVNARKEGGGGSHIWTDEQKNKHSILKSGKPLDKLKGKPSKRKGTTMSPESKNKISEQAKKRYKEGRMYFPLQNPDSAKKASLSKKGKKQTEEHIQKRTQSLKGQKRTEKTKNKIKEKKSQQTYYKNPEFIKRMTDANKKPVLQFDLEGNFLKEWECMGDVLKFFGKGDLTYACKDFNRSSNGYKWKYKE